MNSEIKICNKALSYFGGGQISSLDEASEAARVCSLHYEDARDEVMRNFPWPFASKVTILALSTDTIPGWLYVYQLPVICLRSRRIFNKYDYLADDIPFDIYGDKLVANLPEAYLEFTAKITDPTYFDVTFSKALSYKLASEIVIPLLGNTTRKQEFYAQYEQTIGDAKTTVMRERRIRQPEESSWVEGR